MDVWNFIQQKFYAGKHVMLLYVLHSTGSSPGRQGFKMAVAEDGEMTGSIGGGMMEHKFVETARARLTDKKEILPVYRQVHDKEAGKEQSGMICSGEQTIFLHTIRRVDIFNIDALVDSMKRQAGGGLQLSHNAIVFSTVVPQHNFLFEKYNEQEFLLVEKIGYKNTLHVIGGGHCALAFCKLMRGMDFYIHLYDDRSELNTFVANNYAHEKHIVSSYEILAEKIESGNNVYVVIMTFGYRTDQIVLHAIIEKKFAYIGLLGSKTKVAKMFEFYGDKAGVLEAANVHSPIGLPIKSQTPEEIAISIAAEIILVKNKDQ